MLLNDLQQYFVAVMSNAFGIASGIYGLIELVALLLGKEIAIVPKRWRLGIGLSLLLCAQVAVWRGEHQKINLERDLRSKADAEIKSLERVVSGKDETLNELRTQLASRPPQVQIPPIHIPPSQVQIVRVPDVSTALTLTPRQAAIMADKSQRFSGQKIILFLNNATPEMFDFANTLAAAMKKAGLAVTVNRGMIFGRIPHGISMKIGEGRLDIASVLADLFIEFGWAEKPIPARKNEQDRSAFEITISP